MSDYIYPTHRDMIKDESLVFGGVPLRNTIETIKKLYLSDKRSWIIGYSGGKDSTVVLSLVYFALTTIPKLQLTKPVYVVCSDTLVETPVVVNMIKDVLKAVSASANEQGYPLTTNMVIPHKDDTFWVNLLGKGYPAPTQSFRWCTERMKIDPVSKFIEDKVSKHGEVIVFLGSRKQESASRAQSIEKHAIEGSVLSRHSSLPNAFTYMPIEDWSADEVWEYLLSAPSPWDMSNRQLFDMYKDSNQGECPLVIDKLTPSCGNSRFGCWTCTVVTKDKALEGLIDSGMTWMEPFRDFRRMLYETTKPENKKKYRNYRRRSGRIDLLKHKNESGDYQPVMNEDGTFNYIPGPYWIKYRQAWLKELLEMQKQVQVEGHDYTVVTDEELIEIRKHWFNDPNEPDWEDSLPKIVGEIYPEKYRLFPERDVGAFDTEALHQIKLVSESNGISPVLIKKIIDVEIHASGLGSRRGIKSEIEKLLNQDWQDIDESIEQNSGNYQIETFYKEKLNKLEQNLREFDL